MDVCVNLSTYNLCRETMKKSIVFFLILINFILSSDEGMWEPYELTKLQKELKQSGFSKNVSVLTD